MHLFRRRGKARMDDGTWWSSRPVRSEHAWLPGRVEVQVAGESFHTAAIRRAQADVSLGSPLAAVFIPEPDNLHDSHAVAVYARDQHVGYLPRNVANRVQPALMAFSSVNGGQLVSCPAEIRWHDVGPQVVLWLDPAPLGIADEIFQVIPDLNATLIRLLRRLDDPVPALTGVDEQSRVELASVEQLRADTDADFDRGPEDWPQVERAFRHLAEQLAKARDPFVAAAWLGVGRSTRYQGGHRDATLHALIEALYWDRGNVDAWRELIDFASSTPHVPTLRELFARVPFEARPAVLHSLLTISYGRDRLGMLNPAAGEELRAGLLELAESQGDTGSMALLAADAGSAAEKRGDRDTAAGWWRSAMTAGSTDQKVADRFSIWLIKRHEYDEAARVLRQALAGEPPSAEVTERLRRRLTRCERSLPN